MTLENVLNKTKNLTGNVVRRTLPYLFSLSLGATGISYASSQKTGDVYGPPTPAYMLQEQRQPKQKPSIEDMNVDSVGTHYRFQLSMNQMEDGNEKRNIIAKYVLARNPILKATSQQLSEVEAIDVTNFKELDRLNEIFHEIFLPVDPDRSTFYNEFFDVLDKRVEYAENIQRKCFHDTDNKDQSVVRPVFSMLDDYGKEIIRVGYLFDGERRDDEGGANRDPLKLEVDNKSVEHFGVDQIIHVRFPDNPRKERTFERSPKTQFAWMEPGKTPETRRAMSESAMEVVTNDSTPQLKDEDAAVYFIPVPDESRESFTGKYFVLMNPSPFVVKGQDGKKRVEGKIRTFVYGPNDSLIVSDSLLMSLPYPEGGFSKDDRITFTIPTDAPIYHLGEMDGRFQYALEIRTVKDKSKKWDDAGSVFIDVDDVIPTHFGYVADENGGVRVPAVGQRGDSIRIVFPRQLKSHNSRVALPEKDSTGNYGLEYIVTFHQPLGMGSDNLSREKEGLIESLVADQLIDGTLRTGEVPKTYTQPVLFEVRVNGRDTSFYRDSVFETTHDQMNFIKNYIAPSTLSGEEPVFADTIYCSVNSMVGKHDITIPLPDSVFKACQVYNVSIEVNPRDHDRLSPNTVDSKVPIAYQLGFVKNVKIVNKIPGKDREK